MRKVFLHMLLWLGGVACSDDSMHEDGGADTSIPDSPPIRLAFTSLPFDDAPTAVSDFVFLPGRGMEILVALHRGEIRHYVIDPEGAHLLATMPFTVIVNRECGLIALAVDPAFATNHYLYVGHCASIQRSVLTRLTIDFDDFPGSTASAVEIVAIENPAVMAGVHNLGLPLFDADGSLWLPAGDKDSENAAQDPSSNLGSLLHIIPSRDVGLGGYVPVATEPIAPGASLDVFAYGFRAPWRIALGSRGIWVADVGQDSVEELDLVTAPGQNFGWRTYEGPCDDCPGVTQPITSYDHSSSHPYLIDDPDADATRQRAIFVSPEYPIAADADPYGDVLDGSVLFGDFPAGFIRMLSTDGDGRVTIDAQVGHLQGPSAIRLGPDRYLYASAFGGFDASRPSEGALYRVEAIRTDTP